MSDDSGYTYRDYYGDDGWSDDDEIQMELAETLWARMQCTEKVDKDEFKSELKGDGSSDGGGGGRSSP